MIKLLVFIVFMFLFIDEGLGQAFNRTFQEFEARYRTHNSVVNTYMQPVQTDIVGSPYFNDDFVNGEVYVSETERFSDIPLRYNMYTDQIEFRLADGNVYNFDDPSIIYKVSFNDQDFIFSKFDSNKKGFFFVLYEGKSILCERRTKNYTQKIPSKGIVDEKPAQYTSAPAKSYIILEGRLPQFYGSAKGMVKIFHAQSTVVSNFIKKEKLNVRDSKDVVKVIQFYDSL
jgi:hypothetical protein